MNVHVDLPGLVLLGAELGEAYTRPHGNSPRYQASDIGLREFRRKGASLEACRAM